MNKHIYAAFVTMLFILGVAAMPVSAMWEGAEEVISMRLPEFPAAATMLAFVLAASLFILRRRKK